jgi:hypothetical protein
VPGSIIEGADSGTNIPQTKLSKEEIARRGDELYESSIRPQVETDSDENIVAIDIDSGDYEIGSSILPAVDRLRARQPDAEPYIMRIGRDVVYGFNLPAKGIQRIL